METIARDIRYAVRAVLRNRSVTAVSLVALALGIGANVSCFITVNALVLHPLGYPAIDRVQTLWETVPKSKSDRDWVAPANFLDWKEQSHAFQQVAAYRPWDVAMTGKGDPERVQGCLASAEYFPLLGLEPAMGRVFTRDETEPGRDAVVVVSQGFWRGRMASAPDAVGRTIILVHRPYKVIGVMPADFDYPLATDLWAPLAFTPEEKHQRGSRDVMVMARLKPGVSARQAQSEMDGIARRLALAYPRTNEDRAVTVVPILKLTNYMTDRFTIMLLGCAGFVLLLACANVGNLQLSRAIARQKMFAVEAALGAGRFRIARQLALEGIVVSLAAGIVGLVLADWNLEYTRKKGIPAEVLRWVAGIQHMRIDATVLWFTLGASVAAGLLCGLPAAYHLLRRKSSMGLMEALKEGGRGSAMGSSRSRLRGALMVFEVAMALVLLVGAGLMMRTFRRLMVMGPGYDTKNLLTMQLTLPAGDYRAGANMIAFNDRALRALAAIPDVKEAGTTAYMPAAEGFFVEGRAAPRPGDPIPALAAVSDRYIQALKLPLLGGRYFALQDRPESPRVVMLSESVVKHYWPGRGGVHQAVGQHIRFSGNQPGWFTVVGVVGDVKDWFNQHPLPAAYIPYPQSPQLSLQFVVRTGGDPLADVPAARAAIRAVDRDQPLYEVKSMEQLINAAFSGVRASSNTMTTYAVIALLLAITGIYAVVAYAVVQRTHEIGVRMALGANTADVLKLTLGYALRMAGIGLAIGIPISFLLMRFVSRMLEGVVLVEPLTIAGFAVILGAAAASAGYVPARQATRVDPMIALHVE